MKNLIEIIKQIVPMIVIGALAVIGYALAHFGFALEFIDNNGNILWKSILISVALFIVGYFIYRAAEKLWAK